MKKDINKVEAVLSSSGDREEDKVFIPQFAFVHIIAGHVKLGLYWKTLGHRSPDLRYGHYTFFNEDI